MGKIIVAGGGICGSAVALMLADDGHDVVVLERDAEPPPTGPDAAFSDWDRRSVAQFGLAHWLHSGGTTIMRDHLPDAFRRLSDHGGWQFNIVTYLLNFMPDAELRSDDDRFDVVTGRRAAIEWAISTTVEEHPNISVQRGAAIAGLTANHVDGRPPHVTGVRLADGEVLSGDLVIDATGRRAPTLDWLRDIGAAAPIEHGEDSGFAYYGQYFRGEMPQVLGPLLAPQGSFSILTLPADNDTWAVTLYTLSDDKALRRCRDQDVFNRVIASCPQHAHWLNGEPITEMRSMAGIVDREREFVVDGAPVATGMLTVGDAAACTNPSLGRGITLGLKHAQVLRECVASYGGDPHELAMAFHERTQAEVASWHHDTVTADRRRIREMRIYRDGGQPEPTDDERFGDTFQAAVMVDPEITRGFGEVFGCHALTDEVLARPGMTERVHAASDRVRLSYTPTISRAELLEVVGN